MRSEVTLRVHGKRLIMNGCLGLIAGSEYNAGTKIESSIGHGLGKRMRLRHSAEGEVLDILH